MYISVGAVISIVLGICLYLYQHQGPLDLTGKGTVTVTLTKDGFVPDEIYISRNTTVVFRTTTGNQFWPASDLHPFHTIYSAFDAKGPVAATSTWNFVFNKDGHWSYHDHIGLATGVIIVVPPGEKGDAKYNVLGVCDEPEQSGREACYRQHILLALDTKGLDGATDEVAVVYRDYPEFRSECHSFLHDLGLMAYKKYGDQLPPTKTMYCGQGFYHGYLESFLMEKHGDIGPALLFCAAEAARLGEKTVAGLQCMHGIGHSIMEYLLTTRTDLSNNSRNLQTLVGMGIAECAGMPSEEGKFRCADGAFDVFKAWVNVQNLQTVYTDVFSLDHPFALCVPLREKWQRDACVWEMAKETLVIANHNTGTSLQSVMRAARTWLDGTYMFSAITSVAFVSAANNVDMSDKELIGLCASVVDTMLHSYCIAGLLRGVVFNGAPGAEGVRGAVLCHVSTLTSDEKTLCANTLVTTLVNNYGEVARAAVCVLVADIPGTDKLCTPQ